MSTAGLEDAVLDLPLPVVLTNPQYLPPWLFGFLIPYLAKDGNALEMEMF